MGPGQGDRHVVGGVRAGDRHGHRPPAAVGRRVTPTPTPPAAVDRAALVRSALRDLVAENGLHGTPMSVRSQPGPVSPPERPTSTTPRRTISSWLHSGRRRSTSVTPQWHAWILTRPRRRASSSSGRASTTTSPGTRRVARFLTQVDRPTPGCTTTRSTTPPIRSRRLLRGPGHGCGGLPAAAPGGAVRPGPGAGDPARFRWRRGFEPDDLRAVAHACWRAITRP